MPRKYQSKPHDRDKKSLSTCKTPKCRRKVSRYVVMGLCNRCYNTFWSNTEIRGGEIDSGVLYRRLKIAARYVHENNAFPTSRELMALWGLRSLGTALRTLRFLEAAGEVECDRKTARSCRLTRVWVAGSP